MFVEDIAVIAVIVFSGLTGERYVYKFVCDPEALFNMAYGNSGLAADVNAGHAGSSPPPSHSCRSSSLSSSPSSGCISITPSTTTALLTDRHLSQYYSNYQQLN